MHRAQARQGQHGHHQLRQGRERDAHHVARADPQPGQHHGGAAHVRQQPAVREDHGFVLGLALPDERGHVGAPGGHVAVQAVGAHVQGRARKPAGGGVESIGTGLGPGLAPGQEFMGALVPEAFAV